MLRRELERESIEEREDWREKALGRPQQRHGQPRSETRPHTLHWELKFSDEVTSMLKTCRLADLGDEEMVILQR